MMATFVLLLASNLSAMKLPRSKVSKIPLLSEDYIIAVPLLGGGHISTIDFFIRAMEDVLALSQW